MSTSTLADRIRTEPREEGNGELKEVYFPTVHVRTRSTVGFPVIYLLGVGPEHYDTYDAALAAGKKMLAKLVGPEVRTLRNAYDLYYVQIVKGYTLR